MQNSSSLIYLIKRYIELNLHDVNATRAVSSDLIIKYDVNEPMRPHIIPIMAINL